MTELEKIAADIRRMVSEGAATKAAGAPGQGKTTFPQDGVDDGQTDASEGERGREHASDVEDVVEHASVESTTAPSSESQDSVQPQIGVTQSETGGDPSIEDDYESRQKDPGTGAPAKVGEGEKYAAWSREKLAAEADRLTAAILGPAKPAAKAPAKPAAPTPKEAAAAGYADAAAAAAAARRFAEDTVKEAMHAADLVRQYLPYYHQKAAEGDVPPEELPPEEGAPPEAMAAEAAPPAGGDPGMALEDALGGGEGPPPDAPPTADEAVDGLNGAADDMQLTPEMLQQLLALLQQQGPPVAQKAAKFQKIASAAVDRRMAGRHQIGPPKTAREAAIRERGRRYLAEIVRTAQTNA